MKGGFIIGFALAIDALQAAIAFFFTVFQFATPISGGVAGAFAGCYLNAAAWYDIAGCLKGAVLTGSALAAASAIAIPIGAATDVVISLTFGAALIAVLVFTDTFSLGAVAAGFIGESIPLFDAFIPGWTLMAWRCVHNKKMQEQAAQSAQPAPQAAAEPAPRAVDGIRAPEHLYEAAA